VCGIGLFYRMANVTHPTSDLPPDELIKKVGARFKELREKRGYTNYEKFANAKDIGRAQYGRYEKGEDLRLSSLIKVARALEVSLEELFKGL
jgi:transcriptional regulator with XRE-family HTH domain